jgi:glycosyltransferase involved in cell wall biosynthesis
VPHKRVDLAIAACARVGMPLKIVGEGRSGEALRRLAGPEVEFLGRLDDVAVAEQLARCRALLLSAKEDFGLTAVEAQAAGRPVVALAAGGALETVVPGETGLLVPEATVAAFAAALEELGRRTWSPARARANAARFGEERFARELMAEVEAAIAVKRTRAGAG